MTIIYQRKFGERVRKLRKAQELSQEDFAALIKRDPRTVVAIETGNRNPTLSTINKIAHVLKISMTELFKF